MACEAFKGVEGTNLVLSRKSYSSVDVRTKLPEEEKKSKTFWTSSNHNQKFLDLGHDPKSPVQLRLNKSPNFLYLNVVGRNEKFY